MNLKIIYLVLILILLISKQNQTNLIEANGDDETSGTTTETTSAETTETTAETTETTAETTETTAAETTETTARETTETTKPSYYSNYNNNLFSNRLSRGIGFAAYLIVLLMYGAHLSKKDGGLSSMSAIDLIGLCCVPCFASCFVSFFYHLFFGY